MAADHDKFIVDDVRDSLEDVFELFAGSRQRTFLDGADEALSLLFCEYTRERGRLSKLTRGLGVNTNRCCDP